MSYCEPNDVCVVIAAYNEAAVIARVVADVRRAGYPVVVVDDGSGDGTALVAQSAGAMVIQHPFNLGQGAALQSAIDFALARGADAIVTFDADGQHKASDIPRLARALRDDVDFVLGSRFLGGQCMAQTARDRRRDSGVRAPLRGGDSSATHRTFARHHFSIHGRRSSSCVQALRDWR